MARESGRRLHQQKSKRSTTHGEPDQKAQAIMRGRQLLRRAPTLSTAESPIEVQGVGLALRQPRWAVEPVRHYLWLRLKLPFHSSSKLIQPSKPDVKPPGPIVNALPRGRLFQEVAGKEVSVLGEPGKVASHAPLHLGGGLRRNESSVALRPWNDDGITHAI